ncbi:cytochrome b561 [Paraburkholderia bannensis]|uniref:Cytochrome b561 n=1 Tax=Paraburkholderia bannensis TaxID=765414 RepID=A0A7W9WTA2_9BURK|nr:MULTISPECIES: cytochrome b/b6 domain-containing protein [Paraburkholderia]MBB3258124.1 cytochrome b561 [Paraburkholderia sp. WP4_3_2]MBB6103137.1 cytochrome b561 [Paraburkholderia bannensis]
MHAAANTRYDTTARLLHWLVVLLVAAQFVIGWTMPDVHRDTKPIGEIAWHLGVGTALLAVMACRIAWRATHQPPPQNLPKAIRAISALTHGALYILLLAVPLLGWINASSRAWAVKLGGLAALPSLSPAGSAFGHSMGDVHSALAWALLVLIGLHIAGALYHRFVLGDRVLQRMMP